MHQIWNGVAQNYNDQFWIWFWSDKNAACQQKKHARVTFGMQFERQQANLHENLSIQTLF